MKLLELYLTPVGVHRLRVIASGCGEGEVESELPFWDEEVDRLSTVLKAVATARGYEPKQFEEAGERDWMIKAGILSADGVGFQADHQKVIGQALYKVLFADRVSGVLQVALRSAEAEGKGLHLRLKFAADPVERSRLADYPWELLHDGTRFLLLRSGVSLSRYITDAMIPAQVERKERLRVWLVSSKAADQSLEMGALPDLEREAIAQGLTKAEAVGLISLNIRPRAERRALQRDLTDCSPEERPHVLHFDGHGLYGQRCCSCLRLHNTVRRSRCATEGCGQGLPEPEGFLAMEDGRGGVEWVSAQDFAWPVKDAGVALVVLSACRSGTSVGSESVFSGAAQQLIDQRIPAVVGMQYAVGVEAASDFSEQFYRELGQREPIAQAVSAGRKAMGMRGNQWYRPVLYLRWADDEGGKLFVESQPEPPNVVPPEEVGSSTPSPGGLTETERAFYKRQLASKRAELEAVQEDLETCSTRKSQLKFERDAELLLSEIRELEEKLSLRGVE